MVDEEELPISVAEELHAWHARCAVLHGHEAAKLALSTSERGTLSVEVSEVSQYNALNSLCFQLPNILSDG